MRRTHGLAVALALVAVAAFGAHAKVPPTPYGSPILDSQCYTCHGPGSPDGVIGSLYLIHGPTEIIIKEGEAGLFEVGVEHVWNTDKLYSIVGQVDLSNTPGILFASETPPQSHTATGSVASAASADPSGVTADRSSYETFQVESGATDLVISVTPDPGQSSSALADFALDIWPPGRDPSSNAPIERVDNGAIGEGETFELHGFTEIAEYGPGEWTAGIRLKSAASQDPSGPVSVASYPYILNVNTEFKGTGIPIQFSTIPDELPSSEVRPGQVVYVPWNLYVETVPETATTIPVSVELIAQYLHGDPAIQYDEWRFIKTVDIQIIPDGDSVQFRADAAVAEEVQLGFNWAILSEIVGYVSGFLVLASIYTGGMFGKASRRQLNSVFGTAKRRVAFHNFLSYGILLAAVIHTIVFLVEAQYAWTRGIIWGGVAILAMIGLGVTGAMQVPMIRKWNYAVWRWSHFYLAIGTMVFTVVHILLDGAHFSDIQNTLGWVDPFVPVE